MRQLTQTILPRKMHFPAPSIVILFGLLAALSLLPLSVAFGLNSFYLDLAVRLMIFAIAASSLNLVLGYGGLISLGHAAYLLIGAYSVAIPSFFEIDNGWLHLALTIAASGLFALLTGAISLRTRGAGFIMITLAFSQMVYYLIIGLETFGGSDGISIDFVSDFSFVNLADGNTLYYTTFSILALTLWVTQRITRSRFGDTLTGSRINPERMRSLGYSPYRIQLGAYVIAGIQCGVAGFLLANFVQFITPEMMDWLSSAELIFMVALGGVAHLAGPVFGAFSFVLLEHTLSEWSLYWHLPFGLFLIAVAVFRKGGLAQMIDRFSGTTRDA